jgi:hypothetical protein
MIIEIFFGEGLLMKLLLTILVLARLNNSKLVTPPSYSTITTLRDRRPES